MAKQELLERLLARPNPNMLATESTAPRQLLRRLLRQAAYRSGWKLPATLHSSSNGSTAAPRSQEIMAIEFYLEGRLR